ASLTRIRTSSSATTAAIFAFGSTVPRSLVTKDTSASGSAAFGSASSEFACVLGPVSASMRWALNGGILAERSLVVIDRLPEMRMNGRTRITSRLPTRVAVETRTTLRAAAASLGGGRRSLLCRLTRRSAEPNAPRNAPSTRSGMRAKVISPSSDAKTAPPMRAAPQRPVRIVPLNHCTETRRRSITAASVPSTESGGSWPRSMIPASRPYPPPRDVLWLNPQSPQFLPLASDKTSARRWSAFPRANQRDRRGALFVRVTGALGPAGIGNNSAVRISRYVTATRGNGDFASDRLSLTLKRRQPPLAPGDSMLNYTSERRRIVAQVRRIPRKNSGFFASQNFAG